MRIMRIAAAAGIAAVGVAGFSSAASSAGTVSVTPSTNISTVGTPNVTVSWTGVNAGQVVFIQQCWKTQSDPTFDPANDCSSYNELNPKSNNSGAGTQLYTLFTGAEPNNGLWGCGNPADSAALGIPVYATCYVRLAPDTDTNTGLDFDATISFAPPANTPEVPLNVLLPLGGAAVLGGAYMISRKRQMAKLA
jgi:hypothetical protein